jgi:2-isopropylmalate synthase
VREVAEEHGLELDEAAVARATHRLKELEQAGYAFEAAEASFELLLRAESGEVAPLFTLESFRVLVEKHGEGPARTEAVVKLSLRGERAVTIGEGNGPVHALDRALRAALCVHYPELERVDLTNYTVRILDPGAGTGAVTRVILESSDAEGEWATVGVSPNIIEASWHALVESVTYGVRLRAASEQPA